MKLEGEERSPQVWRAQPTGSLIARQPIHDMQRDRSTTGARLVIMRRLFHAGSSLLGATAFCIALAGCASQHDDSLRLSEELGRARADAAWQRARAAALESRMSRLEQRAGVPVSDRLAEEGELLNRLDRLLAMNERLLAAHTDARVPASAPTLSAEQELRAVVERLRGHPGSPRGGLTREQEGALRVLTRPERTLDTENPWPAAFY